MLVFNCCLGSSLPARSPRFSLPNTQSELFLPAADLSRCLSALRGLAASLRLIIAGLRAFVAELQPQSDACSELLSRKSKLYVCVESLCLSAGSPVPDHTTLTFLSVLLMPMSGAGLSCSMFGCLHVRITRQLMIS